MTAITAQNPTLDFTISIPKVDLKRFKGLVKAMGWSFSKVESYDNNELSPELLEAIEKSRKEIKEGDCVVCNTPEELDAYLESL